MHNDELSETERQAYLDRLGNGWELFGEPAEPGIVDEEDRSGIGIRKEFKCSDFAAAMKFANMVADLAEREAHHPDMCISYGSLAVELITHDRGALTKKDFAMAGKIDELYEHFRTKIRTKK